MNVCEQQGFTLIELLVVVAIIGLLGAIAVPAFVDYKNRASVARVAAELKGFEVAFIAYELENEEFPEDSHLDLPTGMEPYIKASVWGTKTALGGYYNWEGPDSYPYAGVALFNHEASGDLLRSLDNVLDDGVLGAGKFRTGTNGRPVYVIQDS